MVRYLALFSGNPVLVSRSTDLEQVEDVEVVALVYLRQGLLISGMSLVATNEHRIDSETGNEWSFFSIKLCEDQSRSDTSLYYK